jgi:hypothetical protein
MLGAVLGTVLASAFAPAAGAATPDLTIVADARYELRPDAGRIHVSVDLRATNHRTDTAIRRYFVDHGALAVQPGTTGFTIAAVGSKAHPTVRVSSRSKSQTLLAIGFGTKLRSGRSLSLRLQFDIVDRGGAPDREVRVSSTLTAFNVWAFGTTGTPGGTVSVAVPAGYRVAVQGGPLSAATAATGDEVLRAGPLSKPLTFAAYVVAARPGAFRETSVQATVAGQPAAIVVRAWQDDPTFGSRVASVLRRAVPALGDLIGIPIPRPASAAGPGPATPALAVEEAATRTSGGYSASFDVASGTIQVAYNAPPGIVLREAAHAWFNALLVGDGWAAEGFASYYAGQAAGPLKIAIAASGLTAKLAAGRIPLNAWVVGGDAGASGGDAKANAYARAASSVLATLIAERAGRAGLTAVWEAAARGEMADQPAHGGAVETQPVGRAIAAPDWRSLLDLLETRTGRSFEDLWRSWVVRPDDAALLAERSLARASYAAAVAEAGAWELPRSIRTALDDWQFAQAGELIANARALVAHLPALQVRAAAADLTLPVKLRILFEGDAGPAAANEAAAEEATIAQIAGDASVRPRETDFVTRIGLLGSDPDAMLETARAEFATGDLSGAAAAADAAAAAWTGALDAGRTRLTLLGLAFGAFGLAVLLATRWRDRRLAAGAVAQISIASPPSTASSPSSLSPAAADPGSAARPGGHSGSAARPGGHRRPTAHPTALPELGADVPAYGTLARTLPAQGETVAPDVRSPTEGPTGEPPVAGESGAGESGAGESGAGESGAGEAGAGEPGAGSARGDDR